MLIFFIIIIFISQAFLILPSFMSEGNSLHFSNFNFGVYQLMETPLADVVKALEAACTQFPWPFTEPYSPCPLCGCCNSWQARILS